eukprot:TRINITY_DN338_c0_g1_i30.p1 TRINITY_DN338_c0_g1~~TRINITY_DN338_c0_g1_i30.p1  ORF type:complete len:585 (-),score=128.62 TRINITY_DN338_c0_g1_i30:1585-3339(-)
MGFLVMLLCQPFPRKGQTLVIEAGVGTKNFRLTRNDNDYEHLDFVSFESLFRTLSVDSLITLFVCLVEERRVIGIGATVSKVTSCVNAIYSLLYPFTWQHVFIPILPTSLMTMVEAPVPYIIGILKEAQSTLFTDHEIEKGTVILDVDSGKWILAPPNQLELPTRISTLLKKHLERLKSSAELRGQSFNQMVTHIFLFIWVELFIGFSKCFTDNQFNTDRFIKSRTPPYRTFTNAVVQTQMFETFIREREELAAQNRLASCVLAQASIPMLKKKLEPLKRQKSSKRAEVKSKSTSNRNRTEEKKENRKSNELLPVMQHTRSVDDMTKSSEQPTSMLQSISDVERTISSEIDCQEDTSMSIAETTELSDPKTSKEESSPQVPPLSTSQPSSTSSLPQHSPLSTSAVSARLSRGIDEIALQTIKKVVSTTNKRKIAIAKPKATMKRTERTKSETEPQDISSKARQLLGPEFSLTRTFVGLCRDSDGVLLQAFPELQTTIRSSDMKEFIAYLPILKTRFPGVSKYHKQESTSFSLPLHSEILHCFLQFIYQDRINFKILSNERKIENLVAVLRFCEDIVSLNSRERY